MDYFIIISLPDASFKNDMEDISKIIQENASKIIDVKIRPTRQKDYLTDHLIEIESNDEQIKAISKAIEQSYTHFKIKSRKELQEVPWFPKKIEELDIRANEVVNIDLPEDHPGYYDEEYQSRRKMFADIALNYKQGQPIPRVKYTDKETKTWGTLFRSITELHKSYACQEVKDIFPDLIKYCHYREDNIPQLEDVSQFLKSRTGFTVRPVSGFLNSRDFLAALAFKVFNSTQYTRHWTNAHYTPEPDLFHELLGHIPMFANPAFAKFSHQIGLTSLGASDEDIERLATCYVFSVEFGMCLEKGNLKAFGAGLLSSSGELQHAVNAKDKIKEFIPEEVINERYLITDYQKVYFVCNSIEQVKNKIEKFSKSIKRNFQVVYDEDKQEIVTTINEI